MFNIRDETCDRIKIYSYEHSHKNTVCFLRIATVEDERSIDDQLDKRTLEEFPIP